jgi:hypothetical protein
MSIRCSYNLKDVEGTDMNNFYNGDENEREIISNRLKLKLKNWQSNDKIYKIIRYDKNYMVIDNVKTIGLFRSVILNDENKIIAFAPPKSVSLEYFMKNNDLCEQKCIAEEFIEGTMINVFYDNSINAWEFSTRSSIGGNISFFIDNNCKQTFRDMFLSTCSYVGLAFEMLDKEYCYSFVMQHPSNRIVSPINEMALYLVALYKIDQSSCIVYDIDYREYILKNKKLQNATIKLPSSYEATSYSDLIEKYASMNTPYAIPGVVIYSPHGYRTKIRNPNYEYVRELRGNQPKLQYQFLCLRKVRRIVEFLIFYPEYKTYFETFRKQLHQFTHAAHLNYISCYIKKEKSLIEFPKQFRSIMYQLHQLYLNDLRDKKLFVTKQVVIDYINGLHQSQQMYFLNYNFRKNQIDIQTCGIDSNEL